MSDICVCGHSLFNHSRVGWPIDYPFPRCLHRRWQLLPFGWCKCWMFKPEQQESEAAS